MIKQEWAVGCWQHLGNPLKTILFGGLCVASVYLLYRIGLPHYDAKEREQIRSVLDHPQNIELGVWGSSHAICIKPREMGYLGVKFHESGQDLFEVNYKIQSTVPYLNDLKYGIISISYFSFVYDNGRYEHNGIRTRTERRRTMYGRYPLGPRVVPGDAAEFVNGLLTPVITSDHWQRVWQNWGKPGGRKAKPAAAVKRVRPDGISVREALARIEQAGGKETPSSLAQHARRRAKEYYIIEDMLKVHPGLVEDSVAVTIEAIEYLRRRGIRPVLYTPPFHRSYNQHFDRKYQAIMYESIRKIQAATGAEYHDFSKNPEFQDNPALFHNSDHLTDAGGVLFSLRLKEAMEREPAIRR